MEIKKEYPIKLRCATCGCDDQFEYNDDKSYIKCTFCNREYLGGIEELKELNVDAFNDAKRELEKDVIKEMQAMLKKNFKGNKHLKFR